MILAIGSYRVASLVTYTEMHRKQIHRERQMKLTCREKSRCKHAALQAESVSLTPCLPVISQSLMRLDSFATLEFYEIFLFLFKTCPLFVPNYLRLVSIYIHSEDSSLKQEAKQEYLGWHVDICSLIQKQGDHICVPLLRGQMEWSDSLLCHNVRLCSVVQECGSYLHLILLGSDM